jgi:hypothetical protein
MQCYQPNRLRDKSQGVTDCYSFYTCLMGNVSIKILVIKFQIFLSIIHFHKNDSLNIKDDEVGTKRNAEFQTGTNK